MQENDHFADIRLVNCDTDNPISPVMRKTLAIFLADKLPIAQLWLMPGDSMHVPESIPVRRSTRRATMAKPLPSLSTSVIICTRDRPDDLRRCLASFASQTKQPDEIIVVDNASVDPRTREVVQKSGARYLREERPGLDFARNCGARAARSDLVLYTDDDTELHDAWVENTIRAFDEAHISAVTGLVLPAALKTEAQWIFEDQWSFGRGYDRIDYGNAFYEETRRYGCPAWIIGAGANMAFRRAIFDEVGYFDERLDVGQAGCSGDSEYWYRLLAAGHTCRYEPTSVVWHHHRLTLEGLSKQIYFYMRGHAAALLVQHERTRDLGNIRRIFITMPKYYLSRALKRLREPRTASNRFLLEEIRGMISGVVFYVRTPRPASSRRLVKH